MPSFDIVSEIDKQEVENAVNQAKKEIAGRYDFRGSNAELKWENERVELRAEDEYKVGAMKDILQSKLHKRGVDIESVSFSKIEPVGGRMLKMTGEFVQGIDKEHSKKITKLIKEEKLKVQAQIQGEQVRVTSKSIDELQNCISVCKKANLGLPLQFINMRS